MTKKTHNSKLQSARPGRRQFLKTAGTGLAAILASGHAPLFAQTEKKKLVFAHNAAAPEAGAVAFDWFAKEFNSRSKDMVVEFFGATLLTKELDIINAVKSSNVAMGSASGAAPTITPEFGIFMVPYLVRDLKHAYGMFNGKIGEAMNKKFEEKYKFRVLFYYDNGYRHFFNSKRALVEPKDLRGLKLRVQQGKVFADAVNGLGGTAVPMPFSELVPAAQTGVIDGGDMPLANFVPVKLYEVSKYASLSYHVFSPSYVAINPQLWYGLTDAQRKLLTDVSMECQAKMSDMMGSIDNLDSAKKLLEPRGMSVNRVDIAAFSKAAQEKIWPEYKKLYADSWDEVANFKS
jgi:tripartite ATP-independent transporter DctP family solute receptor